MIKEVIQAYLDGKIELDTPEAYPSFADFYAGLKLGDESWDFTLYTDLNKVKVETEGVEFHYSAYVEEGSMLEASVFTSIENYIEALAEDEEWLKGIIGNDMVLKFKTKFIEDMMTEDREKEMIEIIGERNAMREEEE